MGLTRPTEDVAVGDALLGVEKMGRRPVLHSLYRAVLLVAIAFGLYDGSDDPPMDVVVTDARTSRMVYRDGPHIGFDSAYAVLEVFAEEIRESGLDHFLRAHQR